MQVICAMMSIKANQENDAKITTIFQDMRNKIQAMALVHQKLYQSQNLSEINLKDYISELVDLLISSYSIQLKKIGINKEFDDIFVLIDTAIPCGLIINEIISNSLKYAFSDGTNGQINVSLKKNENDLIKLTISDNGIGLPDGFNIEKDGKMGIQTILAIVRQQLQGEVAVEIKNGVSYTISFSDVLYEKRI